MLVRLGSLSRDFDHFIRMVIKQVYLMVAVVFVAFLIYGSSSTLVMVFFAAMMVRMVQVDFEATYDAIKEMGLED